MTTFTEHTGLDERQLRLLSTDQKLLAGVVTGIQFAQSGLAIVSASLDGTVRAYDRLRYRNFRTFTSPTPVQACSTAFSHPSMFIHPSQFASLALDPSGEIVCAGTQDSFEVFVWSMQSGRLLDVLSGHEV